MPEVVLAIEGNYNLKNLKFEYFATRIVYNNGYSYLVNYFCD